MRKTAPTTKKPGTTPASPKTAPPAKKATPAKKAPARQPVPTQPAATKKAKTPAKAAKPAQPAPKPLVSRFAVAVTVETPQAPEQATQEAPKPLTISEERFAAEYFVTLNATQAYKSVHPAVTDGTARAEGARTLAKPNVQGRVAELRAEAQARTGITIDNLVNMLGDMALADDTLITSWRVGACRHCYGIDFLRQRTNAEFKRAQRDVETGNVTKPRKRKGQSPEDHAREMERMREFDPEGGPGYNKAREPNPECPECVGEGIGRMVVADTRTLGPRERRLHSGVEETEKGFKIVKHDKQAAVEKLMRHLGAYEKDNKQKGGDLGEWLGQMGKTAALPVVKNPPRDSMEAGDLL